jgi:acyl carrier protein
VSIFPGKGGIVPDVEKTAETTILETIQSVLERRGATELQISPEAKLTADLGLDSLELAEISAVLEDELGSDPYSAGIVPETVGELVDFYRH